MVSEPPIHGKHTIFRTTIFSLYYIAYTYIHTRTSFGSDLLHSFKTSFELKQLHAHIIKTNTTLSILSLARVGSVCAFTSSFTYTYQIIERYGNPEIVVSNTCSKCLAESDSPNDAILLFYKLREFDVLPDSFTCSFVLKACSKLLDVMNGRIVHGVIVKLGFEWNLFLLNTIVHLYASGGAMRDARILFDKMPERDVVTWNTMVTQLVKFGDVNGAYELLLRMPERSVRSWTSMIAGFVQCGKPREAVGIFTQMEEAGLRPNEVMVVVVLAACADCETNAAICSPSLLVGEVDGCCSV